MADNVTLPGTGSEVATDEVDGKHYQKVKIVSGGDGVADEISIGFGATDDTTISIDESGTTTTITETDGVKTLTITIDESTNPIAITKVWT